MNCGWSTNARTPSCGPRVPGLDGGWVQAAKRLKGTMLVVLSGGHPDPGLAPRPLADLVDARARDGQALGAIIGVVEERQSLPLLF
jgi:hypothetical protein